MLQYGQVKWTSCYQSKKGLKEHFVKLYKEELDGVHIYLVFSIAQETVVSWDEDKN